MATQSDVNEYINNILLLLSQYGAKVTKGSQIGYKSICPKKVKLMLLQAFVNIAILYLEQWDSITDNNYMTVTEFEEIINHINTISNSNIWLEL